VSIANSEFPTTNLYVNGELQSWYSRSHLAQFIAEGGETYNPEGIAYLALHPTCGQSITSGSKSLQAQPVPGSCRLAVLAGPRTEEAPGCITNYESTSPVPHLDPGRPKSGLVRPPLDREFNADGG
jgi:hypothetical protein